MSDELATGKRSDLRAVWKALCAEDAEPEILQRSLQARGESTAAKGARGMSDGTACAHLKVKYDPVKHRNDTLTARWVCELCGHEFVPNSWLQGVVENRNQIAVTNAELGLLLVDQLEIKNRVKEIYELTMGDTDNSPWHSDFCYHRSGAHRDPNLCTCGLSEVRHKLDMLYRELPMPSLDDVLEERRSHRADIPKVGDTGIRDPEHPCEAFVPGEPGGDCASDGHYMCDECEERMPYLPERDGEPCSYCSESATELIETDAGPMPACDFHAKDPKKLNPKQAKRFVQLAVSKDELAEKEEKYTFTGVSFVESGGHPFKIVGNNQPCILGSNERCEGCGVQQSPLGEGPPLMRETTIGCEKGRLLCPDCLALARLKDEG